MKYVAVIFGFASWALADERNTAVKADYSSQLDSLVDSVPPRFPKQPELWGIPWTDKSESDFKPWECEKFCLKTALETATGTENLNNCGTVTEMIAAKNGTFSVDTRNQTKAMCYCYSAALDFEKAVIGCMTDGVQCEYSLPARQKEHDAMWADTTKLTRGWCSRLKTTDKYGWILDLVDPDGAEELPTEPPKKDDPKTTAPKTDAPKAGDKPKADAPKTGDKAKPDDKKVTKGSRRVMRRGGVHRLL